MEERRHVQEGREDNSLHKLGVAIDEVTTKYCEKHEDATIIFIASDKDGYVCSANGYSAKDIAKALINSANKDSLISDALGIIVNDVLKALS